MVTRPFGPYSVDVSNVREGPWQGMYRHGVALATISDSLSDDG